MVALEAGQEWKEELGMVADRQELKQSWEVLQEPVVVVVAWVELATDKGPKREAEQELKVIAVAGRGKEQALEVLQESVVVEDAWSGLAKGTESK